MTFPEPIKDVVMVLTFRSAESIVDEGGSQAWALDRVNAKKAKWLVCVRNANHHATEGPEAHRTAFLVGKIADVVPAPDNEKRYLIKISQWAKVDEPDVWDGSRNPVRYLTANEVPRIDFDNLKLTPLKKKRTAEPAGDSREMPAPAVRGLTIAEAKRGLALRFGVSEDAIEIIVRA